VIFLSFLRSVGRNPNNIYGLPPTNCGNDMKDLLMSAFRAAYKNFIKAMKNAYAFSDHTCGGGINQDGEA